MIENAVIHFGTVVRVEGDKLYVQVPALGGNDQFGPLTSVILRYIDSGSEQIRDTYYEKGDRVIVGQVGRVKEDLVVLGRVG